MPEETKREESASSVESYDPLYKIHPLPWTMVEDDATSEDHWVEDAIGQRITLDGSMPVVEGISIDEYQMAIYSLPRRVAAIPAMLSALKYMMGVLRICDKKNPMEPGTVMGEAKRRVSKTLDLAGEICPDPYRFIILVPADNTAQDEPSGD